VWRADNAARRVRDRSCSPRGVQSVSGATVHRHRNHPHAGGLQRSNRGGERLTADARIVPEASPNHTTILVAPPEVRLSTEQRQAVELAFLKVAASDCDPGVDAGLHTRWSALRPVDPETGWNPHLCTAPHRTASQAARLARDS
jgi:hypothetical protein